jgi:hypothetical protein
VARTYSGLFAPRPERVRERVNGGARGSHGYRRADLVPPIEAGSGVVTKFAVRNKKRKAKAQRKAREKSRA